jgi:hypothetical protein
MTAAEVEAVRGIGTPVRDVSLSANQVDTDEWFLEDDGVTRTFL